MLYKRQGTWHLDATVNGIRYRESLKTSDKREASALEKKRVSEILAGKGASKTGRDFARKPFPEAVKSFLAERTLFVAPATLRKESDCLKPLAAHFGQTALIRIRAEQISAYQRERSTRVSASTVNTEVSILRAMLKRGKAWAPLAEDVRMLRESKKPVARVLSAGDKRILFDVAQSRDEWLVAFCAAVLAVSTTCRGIELKHLRWSDVDRAGGMIAIGRSKTTTGLRQIPLNTDALGAVEQLWKRATLAETNQPEHYVFPACEHQRFDPTRPQKSWRTAWRKMRTEASRAAGRQAARIALDAGKRLGGAKVAYKLAATPFVGFRFHDLRHQAITELSEGGASDSTIMALAGHLSRRMMEHYSHVRMAAKRSALDGLSSGLIGRNDRA